MSCSVEAAIKAAFPVVPVTLHTIGQGKPFVLETIDADGIVLLLGSGGWWTRASSECLESIPGFLRGRGWVRVGGVHSVQGEPGTLDEHLKRFLKRDVARWLVVVLAAAGVVEVREGPLSVRLKPAFGDC